MRILVCGHDFISQNTKIKNKKWKERKIFLVLWLSQIYQLLISFSSKCLLSYQFRYVMLYRDGYNTIVDFVVWMINSWTTRMIDGSFSMMSSKDIIRFRIIEGKKSHSLLYWSFSTIEPEWGWGRGMNSFPLNDQSWANATFDIFAYCISHPPLRIKANVKKNFCVCPAWEKKVYRFLSMSCTWIFELLLAKFMFEIRNF